MYVSWVNSFWTRREARWSEQHTFLVACARATLLPPSQSVNLNNEPWSLGFVNSSPTNRTPISMFQEHLLILPVCLFISAHPLMALSGLFVVAARDSITRSVCWSVRRSVTSAFTVILGHFRSFQVIISYFKSFFSHLNHFKIFVIFFIFCHFFSYFVIFYHCLSFLVITNHLESF